MCRSFFSSLGNFRAPRNPALENSAAGFWAHQHRWSLKLCTGESGAAGEGTRNTSAYLLAHLLQTAYDPTLLFRIGEPLSRWQWFHEAVAVWFEEAEYRRRHPGGQFRTDNTKMNANFLMRRRLEFPGATGSPQPG